MAESLAVAARLPGRNSQVLPDHNPFSPVPELPNSPGAPRAILMLSLYGAVALIIAVLIFRRRELRGAA